MQLIPDKITTPPELPLIARGRLLNLLHGSLASCTSTIVNGRAGTGKTMLVADFARRGGRRVAWFKVDASDSDQHIFFKYLVGSVRKERPGFGQETLAYLVETATIEEMPLLAESFIYELLERTGDPLLVVIDDLHLVYDAEWVVPFFSRLLPLLPQDAHVILTGRSLPPAPLWRMRSKQTLCVIEESNLAFTQDETEKLFEHYGLSPAQASVALKQTHGRVAALDALARLMSVSEKAAELMATNKRLRKLRTRQVHGYSF